MEKENRVLNNQDGADSLTQEASFSQSFGSQNSRQNSRANSRANSRQNLRQDSRDRLPHLFRRHNAMGFDIVAFNYQELEGEIADFDNRYDLGNATTLLLDAFDIVITQPSLQKTNEGLIDLVEWMAREINGKLASYALLTCFYRDVKRAITRALRQNPNSHELVSDISKIWDKKTYLIANNDDEDLESTEDAEEFNWIRAAL